MRVGRGEGGQKRRRVTCQRLGVHTNRGDDLGETTSIASAM